MSNKSAKAAEEVATTLEGVESKRFTLSNGIVLEAKYVSAFVYNEIQKKFKNPKVPRVYIEDIGREEENPNDPEYIEAVQERDRNLSDAISDAMFLMGVNIISIPGNMPGIDEDNWIEKLSILGVDVPENQYRKKLAYLKYIACANPKDLELTMAQVGRESGATEEDVKRAAESFRSDAERDTDS